MRRNDIGRASLMACRFFVIMSGFGCSCSVVLMLVSRRKKVLNSYGLVYLCRLN